MIEKFPVHHMLTVKLLLDCFTRVACGWILGKKCLLRKSGSATAQGAEGAYRDLPDWAQLFPGEEVGSHFRHKAWH